MVSLEELLQLLVQRGGSDLHIAAGSPPRIRVDGKLLPTEFDTLTKEESQKLVYGCSRRTRSPVREGLELDFSFGVDNLGRFRTNVFLQRGSVGRSSGWCARGARFDDWGCPRGLHGLCESPRGLVLVTGPRSGKSTTLAAMIDYINGTGNYHIITVEDPIEFVHKNKNCLINQREWQRHAHFRASLKHVLRQDPDVVLIARCGTWRPSRRRW